MSSDIAFETHLDVAGESRLHQHLRHFWHPVAFSHDVSDDEPVQGELMGERLTIWRHDGEVRVFRDLCRHRGASLALGRIDRGCIRCAYHGWAYSESGVVVDIPSRPGIAESLNVAVDSFPAAESAGIVWACLDREPRFPVPQLPVLDDPTYTHLFYEPYDWRCSMARRVENYFDFSHFAHVHHGSLGDRDDAVVADYEVRRVGGEIRINAGPFLEFTDNPKNEGLKSGGGTYMAWKRYRIFMPNTMLLHSSAGPDGEDYTLFVAVAPLAPRLVRCFTIQSRNYAPDKDKEFREFQALILGQDKPVVESQRPEELPDDLAGEMHVKGVDTGTLEYRRWLIEISNGHYEQAPAADGR